MKLLAFALLFLSPLTFANSLDLSFEKGLKQIQSNKQQIEAVEAKLLEYAQKIAERNNILPELNRIEGHCGKVDIPKGIANMKRLWIARYVSSPKQNLELNYRHYGQNAKKEMDISLRPQEQFNTDKELISFMDVRICDYSPLFEIGDDEMFTALSESAFGDYAITLSIRDILGDKYQRAIEEIIKESPIKVKRTASKVGNPLSSYRRGTVNIKITYDRNVFATPSVYHPEMKNPILIIQESLK